MGACGSKQTVAALPELAVAAQAPPTVAAPAPVHETEAVAGSLPSLQKAEILRLKADIMYVEHRMKDLSAEKASELKSKVTEMHANMAKLEDYLAKQDERAFDLGFITDIIHNIRDSIVGVLGDIEEAIGNATGSVETKIEEFTAWTQAEIALIENKIENLAEEVVARIDGWTSGCSCGMNMFSCCQDHDDGPKANRPYPGPSPPKPSWFEYLCNCQGCRCCRNPPSPHVDEHEILVGSKVRGQGSTSTLPDEPGWFEYLCNCQGCRCCRNPPSPHLDEHEIVMGSKVRGQGSTSTLPDEPGWFEYLCGCQGCRCCQNVSGPFADCHEIRMGREMTPETDPFVNLSCPGCECCVNPHDDPVTEMDLSKQVGSAKKA